MTYSLSIVCRLVVSFCSLIVITNNIVICIYQTITYNLKTTNSEQVAYLRNLNQIIILGFWAGLRRRCPMWDRRCCSIDGWCLIQPICVCGVKILRQREVRRERVSRRRWGLCLMPGPRMGLFYGLVWNWSSHKKKGPNMNEISTDQVLRFRIHCWQFVLLPHNPSRYFWSYSAIRVRRWGLHKIYCHNIYCRKASPCRRGFSPLFFVRVGVRRSRLLTQGIIDIL